MNIVKLTDKIWQYKDLDLDVAYILDKLNNTPEYNSWFDYTNGFLLDGSEYESLVKGEAICIYPESEFYNIILNTMISCIQDYLSSNNDSINIGNLDINPIDANGNKRSTHMLIRKYLPGTTMSAHEDAILPMNGGGYTVLLYLNDDYDGGELKFNNEGFAVKPSAGSLLIFPERIEHEILLLKNGERYMTAAYIFREYPLQTVSAE